MNECDTFHAAHAPRTTGAGRRAVVARRRSPGRLALAGTPALLLAALLLACTSAPPAPPPEPLPPPVEAPVEVVREVPPPPPVILRVTGTSLNVREGPSTSRTTVGKVKRGETLTMLGEADGWYQVRLASGGTGWVHGKYVRKEEPCLPDKATAEILNEPEGTLRPAAGTGRVVIEATVNAQGAVASTKLLENSTGSPEQLLEAERELRTLRFSPPVRKCRPVPFIYVYTRNF